MKKVIIFVSSIFLILLIGGCLFYKSSDVQLMRITAKLEKYGFNKIEEKRYELIQEGLSEEEYLRQNNGSKKTKNIIIDLSTNHIIYNNETKTSSNETNLNIDLNLTNLLMTGYYTNNEHFITGKYDVNNNSFECSDDETTEDCRLLQKETNDFFDEVNKIITYTGKNLNNFNK